MPAAADEAPRRIDRFLPWKWSLWRNRKWQKSSAVSALMWIASTKLVVQYEHIAAGWLLIITVGLFADTVTWAINKLFIWVRHPSSSSVSIGRNTAVWCAFFLVNAGTLWALNRQAGMSTLDTREIMIPYGILINPLRFHINDRLVFGRLGLRDVGRKALWRA